ncbi:hypothetical protein QVM88_07410 [Providencia stuartii]|nr:hypothetical protein [Providencia stuartii]MDN0006213.1 hypothetical protein [Providencia stuartii]
MKKIPSISEEETPQCFSNRAGHCRRLSGKQYDLGWCITASVNSFYRVREKTHFGEGMKYSLVKWQQQFKVEKSFFWHKVA